MSNRIQELLENLKTSGLLSAEEVSKFHTGFATRGVPKSPEHLAKDLVKHNYLTKLQAAAVVKGKTRNLIFGDYIVIDKIGSGGMGQVFKARHKPTRKLVAMKVLSAEAVSNRRLIERFKKEAKAIGRLKHPNVVRAYEAGKINKIRYLVMEYVDGENMLARVKRKGPLSIDEVVNCILQAARGLDYAHQQGIIHRDIKPSNLLRDRSTGRVKVVDLGLARVEEPDEDAEDQIRLTMAGQMLGTARFMAPEQVEDARKADVRSDVYSLACTMYYLLRGKAPYSGETVAHTLMAHVSSPIPNLCRKRPDAPEWIGAVFNRMMAKKPRDRYQSMGQLVADIQRHLAGTEDDDADLHDELEPDDEYSAIVSRKDLGASIADLYIPPEEVDAAEQAERAVTGEDQETARQADLPDFGFVEHRDDNAPPGLAETRARTPDQPSARETVGFASPDRRRGGPDLDTADFDAHLADVEDEFEDAPLDDNDSDPQDAASDDDGHAEPPGDSGEGSDALADAQSFDISDELKIVKESGVTDYVTQKLKGRQSADARSNRRIQLFAGVVGLIVLVTFAVWLSRQ